MEDSLGKSHWPQAEMKGGGRGQSSPIEDKWGTVEHWLPVRWGRGGEGNKNITKSYVGIKSSNFKTKLKSSNSPFFTLSQLDDALLLLGEIMY